MSSKPTAPSSIRSEPASGYTRSFIPKPNQSIGSVLPDIEKYPQNAKPPKLFQELEIRGLKLNNRMMAVSMASFMALTCQRLIFLSTFPGPHVSM
jgi:hypothetical protein